MSQKDGYYPKYHFDFTIKVKDNPLIGHLSDQEQLTMTQQIQQQITAALISKGFPMNQFVVINEWWKNYEPK